MAEEKSVIEILERQVELTKKMSTLNAEMIGTQNNMKVIQEELDAIKDIVKDHIKTQKNLHAAVFDTKYGYKGNSYSKKE